MQGGGSAPAACGLQAVAACAPADCGAEPSPVAAAFQPTSMHQPCAGATSAQAPASLPRRLTQPTSKRGGRAARAPAPCRLGSAPTAAAATSPSARPRGTASTAAAAAHRQSRAAAAAAAPGPSPALVGALGRGRRAVGRLGARPRGKCSGLGSHTPQPAAVLRGGGSGGGGSPSASAYTRNAAAGEAWTLHRAAAVPQPAATLCATPAALPARLQSGGRVRTGMRVIIGRSLVVNHRHRQRGQAPGRSQLRQRGRRGGAALLQVPSR